MRNFRELDVWRKAHELVQAVYRATKRLPKEEIFGLTVQLRRAGTAVATRIAEGCGVDSDVEFGGYLQRSKAAASELEYLLLLARDLEYLPEAEFASLSEDVIVVKKMLSGFCPPDLRFRRICRN
ncbi:MAG TPA: four helix bundle protein [Edaphobacter sp.]